jgi:hypothetical protein
MIFDDRIGVRDYAIDPDQTVQLLELSRRLTSLAGFKVNSNSKTNHTPGPYLKIHGCVTRTDVQRSLIVVFELWLEDAMETAKWIIAFVGLLGIGGFLADSIVWEIARQHMKNPAWPPHAKFHNGQTILMGIGLGALTFVFLFGSGPPGLRNLLLATGTASLYWISMVLAPTFPGTAWNDPEFRAPFHAHLECTHNSCLFMLFWGC